MRISPLVQLHITGRMKSTLLGSLAVPVFLMLSFTLRAEYMVVIETGDTLISKKSMKRGTKLALSDRDVLLNDIVFVVHKEERWTYRSADGQKWLLPVSADKIIAFACAYAAKYGADKALGDFHLVDPAWASDPKFIACYRTALLDQWIRSDIRGRPLKNDTIKSYKSEELSVVLRTGDTLMIGKNSFFMKKDTLCWFGGGRIPENQVLLLRSPKGLQILPEWNDRIVKFEQPIPDLSPASRGVIYAHIFKETKLPDLPASDLADAAVILAAGATEDAFIIARAKNRTSTLSGVAIGVNAAKTLLMLVP